MKPKYNIEYLFTSFSRRSDIETVEKSLFAIYENASSEKAYKIIHSFVELALKAEDSNDIDLFEEDYCSFLQEEDRHLLGHLKLLYNTILNKRFEDKTIMDMSNSMLAPIRKQFLEIKEDAKEMVDFFNRIVNEIEDIGNNDIPEDPLMMAYHVSARRKAVFKGRRLLEDWLEPKIKIVESKIGHIENISKNGKTHAVCEKRFTISRISRGSYDSLCSPTVNLALSNLINESHIDCKKCLINIIKLSAK